MESNLHIEGPAAGDYMRQRIGCACMFGLEEAVNRKPMQSVCPNRLHLHLFALPAATKGGGRTGWGQGRQSETQDKGRRLLMCASVGNGRPNSQSGLILRRAAQGTRKANIIHGQTMENVQLAARSDLVQSPARNCAKSHVHIVETQAHSAGTGPEPWARSNTATALVY